MLGGAEMAGIKFHAPIDCLIKNNWSITTPSVPEKTVRRRLCPLQLEGIGQNQREKLTASMPSAAAALALYSSF